MSIQQLKEITHTDVSRFSLKGIKTRAKVVAVHDGDTCDLAFYYGVKIVRFKCRLDGIDAPELKEGRNAKLSRDFLAHLCTGGDPEEFDDDGTWTKPQLQEMLDENEELVYAIFGEFDRYGRPLVILKKSKRSPSSFNDMLLEYGYADKYE